MSDVFPTTVVINESAPLPVGYNHTILKGRQIIDYIWAQNKVNTTTEIESIESETYAPVWDNNTILLANFNNTLNGGSVVTLNENIINWSIYKKRVGDLNLDYVATLPANRNTLIDYNITNQTEYQYYVFPITANTVGNAMVSKPVTSNWWNWSLTGIKETSTENLYYADVDNIWLFRLNLKSNTVEQNMDKTIYEGFTQYPKISVGERNYLTGSISCLLGDVINAAYVNDTPRKQKDFMTFLQNGQKKLLKDPKGNIGIVDIVKNSFNIMDDVKNQPTVVSWDWCQIGKSEFIQVIEE